MRFKYLKEFALLAGVIIIAAVGARLLAGGETLSDYAKKNPDAAIASSTEESAPAAASEEISVVEPANDEASLEVSILPEPEPEPDPEPEPEPSPERITYMDGFYYEPISNEIFKRISGISYPVDCTVSLDELRYVGLKYIDFNGETQTGELICNKALAEDMVEIFYELYTNDYRIESVKLVDEYGGDDTASMLANNTSCFNYRVVEGTTRLSNHAYGRAIDLNPFYNPYVTYNKDGTTNIYHLREAKLTRTGQPNSHTRSMKTIWPISCSRNTALNGAETGIIVKITSTSKRNKRNKKGMRLMPYPF